MVNCCVCRHAEDDQPNTNKVLIFITTEAEIFTQVKYAMTPSILGQLADYQALTIMYVCIYIYIYIHTYRNDVLL